MIDELGKYADDSDLIASLATQPASSGVQCAFELLAARRRPRLLNSQPADRAGAFYPARCAHALLKAGSKKHEEQMSTRCHAIVSTPDNVERC
jgi:hypothetical protein